jgi:molybdate transport system substrate-binding protein
VSQPPRAGGTCDQAYRIPEAENSTAIYARTEVQGAARPEAARAWLAFIGSPDALKIVERYGFKPHRGDAG